MDSPSMILRSVIMALAILVNIAIFAGLFLFSGVIGLAFDGTGKPVHAWLHQHRIFIDILGTLIGTTVFIITLIKTVVKVAQASRAGRIGFWRLMMHCMVGGRTNLK